MGGWITPGAGTLACDKLSRVEACAPPTFLHLAQTIPAAPRARPMGGSFLMKVLGRPPHTPQERLLRFLGDPLADLPHMGCEPHEGVALLAIVRAPEVIHPPAAAEFIVLGKLLFVLRLIDRIGSAPPCLPPHTENTGTSLGPSAT